MDYMIITNVPEIARFVEQHGVDRIFLDMETRGKDKRQHREGTPIHCHSFSDVVAVKKALSTAEVMLRINPLYEGSGEEIERAIDSGADRIMLPYFQSREEVESFLALVGGRVKTSLLLESAAAVGRAEQILDVDGIGEVHFGLNDLRIDFKLNFLFETFAGGLIDWLAALCRARNIYFGVGGIGRIEEKELQLPAELVLRENIRVGSRRIILSRVFHKEAQSLEELKEHLDFPQAMENLRAAEKIALERSEEEVARDRQKFIGIVEKIAAKTIPKR